jgi:hypothetical protein
MFLLVGGERGRERYKLQLKYRYMIIIHLRTKTKQRHAVCVCTGAAAEYKFIRRASTGARSSLCAPVMKIGARCVPYQIICTLAK